MTTAFFIPPTSAHDLGHAILLSDILVPRQGLEISSDMETAHVFPLKGYDVVNVVRYSGFPRQLIRTLIDSPDRVHVSPSRSRTRDQLLPSGVQMSNKGAIFSDPLPVRFGHAIAVFRPIGLFLF
jgi:hypothetical protein